MKKLILITSILFSNNCFSQKIGIDTSKKYHSPFILPKTLQKSNQNLSLLSENLITQSEIDKMPILATNGKMPTIPLSSNDKMPNIYEKQILREKVEKEKQKLD